MIVGARKNEAKWKEKMQTLCVPCVCVWAQGFIKQTEHIANL